MQKPKRAKSIKIRVSEAEFIAMRERCDRPQLAGWLRSQALGQPKKRAVPTTDPALLRQLAAIGNNLNQLAKWANATKPTSSAGVVAALIAIDRELEAIRVSEISR
jgi:hypothetical protein